MRQADAGSDSTLIVALGICYWAADRTWKWSRKVWKTCHFKMLYRLNSHRTRRHAWTAQTSFTWFWLLCIWPWNSWLDELDAEAGTVYCRPTRIDSGDTANDMTINRVFAAGWSAVYDGINPQTLEMTGTQNVASHFLDPLVEVGIFFETLQGSKEDSTLREVELLLRNFDFDTCQAQQYDIYCWARDNAVDPDGFSISNVMSQLGHGNFRSFTGRWGRGCSDKSQIEARLRWDSNWIRQLPKWRKDCHVLRVQEFKSAGRALQLWIRGWCYLLYSISCCSKFYYY